MVGCTGQVTVTGGIPQPWNQVAIACACCGCGGVVAVVQPSNWVGPLQVFHAVCGVVFGFSSTSLWGHTGGTVAQAMLVAQMALATWPLMSCGQDVAAAPVGAGLSGLISGDIRLYVFC